MTRCLYCLGGQVLVRHYAATADEPGSDETEDCDECGGSGLDASDPLLGADDGPAIEPDGAIEARVVDRFTEVVMLAVRLGGGGERLYQAARCLDGRAS